MFWVSLISALIFFVPVDNRSADLPVQQDIDAQVADLHVVDVQPTALVERTMNQPESPDWPRTIWGSILFVSLVIALIFGGAYGIHLYQMRHLHKRADELEHVVSLRTDEVNRINQAHSDVIDALAATNGALLDTNDLLERANDRLNWANSQLSHTNRSLEMRTAELNFALEQNREILGVTVHDLKNPLGGVLGISEIIQEDLAYMPNHERMPDVQENVGLVHQAAKQMLLNVEGMLDRHGHGAKGPLQKEEVFLNDIIVTTLKWNRVHAKNKGLKIFFSGQQEKVAVRVDVTAMQRVMDNLLSNAIKYSAMHSRIWVEMLTQEKDVWVSVRDEGPGLTDEDLQRVFGKQQRLSAQPTAGEHSSGYGLYIVKQFIEQHGGQVGVESVLGEGAAFWFKIPIAESVAAPGYALGVLV